MDLRQLRYFSALAQELHFGRAAERVCITQPALSSSIHQFEESLGLQLFERDSKHVRLTSAGQALLSNAEEVLLHVNRAAEFAKALSGGFAGKVDVGFAGTMLYRGLGAMMPRFWATYPMVELQLHEMTSLEQLTLLRAGKLDAAFVNDCAPPPQIDSHVICLERFMACVPEHHPFAGRASIRLTELEDESFVMFKRSACKPYYDYIIRICAEAGFEPRECLEINQQTTVAAFVANGAGVAILPAAIARSRPIGARFIALEGIEPVPCAFFLWNASRMPPGLDALLACVRTTWPSPASEWRAPLDDSRK